MYRAKGYAEGGINQRRKTIERRKELTDEWKARGVSKDKEYAILTDEMTKAWRAYPCGSIKSSKACARKTCATI